MDGPLWQVALGVVIGLLLGLLLRRRAPKNDLSGVPPQMPRPPSGNGLPPLSPEQAAAVQAELARGNKIAAIKLLREASGLGLKESKDAIERMAGE